MNYNANTGSRQPAFGRKIKRVSDVNSMGYNPYETGGNSGNNFQTSNLYPGLTQDNSGFQTGYSQNPQYDNPTDFGTPKVGQNQNFSNFGQQQAAFNNIQSPPSAAPAPPPPSNNMPNIGMLGQPIVQDMAMQYGQQLAGAGKTLLTKEVERFVPVSTLKYYFSVDTNYVISKLMLLFFPFTHKDWSVKYEQDGPIQPRYEINAPDLYIPTMGYITYVLIAGLMLGMQQRFTPEQIGILASSALAWCIVELAIYTCTLYVVQIETSLKTLDLLAYSGYKYIGVIMGVLMSIIGGRMGYYACLIYMSLALGFFLVRSLKMQVLSGNSDYYNGTTNAAITVGRKRKLYFLLFVAAVQPILSWWLSYHLIASNDKITT